MPNCLLTAFGALIKIDTRCFNGYFCLLFHHPVLLIAIQGVQVAAQCVPLLTHHSSVSCIFFIDMAIVLAKHVQDTRHQTITHNQYLAYNSGYSSPPPSLVIQVCQRVWLYLLDLHGHDHLADAAAARSACRCRRRCFHWEHAVGRQGGADPLYVKASGQPERHKKEETSSHILQLQLCIFITWLLCVAQCHVFVGDLLVFPSEASRNHSVYILSFLMISFKAKTLLHVFYFYIILKY